MQPVLATGARQKFAKLGIQTVEELLYYFPYRYDDFSRVVPLGSLQPGDMVAVEGALESIKIVRTWKQQLVEAWLADQGGRVRVVWFNQTYLIRTLKIGMRVALAGKVYENRSGVYFANPAYELLDAGALHTRRLVPVYHETAGMTSRWLRKLVEQHMHASAHVVDILPEHISAREKFLPVGDALRAMHFPHTQEEANSARVRFQFEQVFLLQLRFLAQRMRMEHIRAHAIPFNQMLVKRFVDGLPFTLTDGQRKAAWQILQDLRRAYPMQRLLEGDVGSGKTIVVFMAALEVVHAGYQVALMAPTEVLARQHFLSAKRILGAHGITIGFATSTAYAVAANSARESPEKKVTKKTFQKMLGEGTIQLAVGTHALIARSVAWHDLALAITDEQHRFGVRQRSALAHIEGKHGASPHFLSMSATPIPRTLALAVYGDLDISRITEMPSGREVIETRVVLPSRRQEAYAFIHLEVQKGRQVFVICPRIEQATGGGQSSDTHNHVFPRRPASSVSQSALWDVRAVKQEYEKLSRTVFPDLRIGMLHGKLKPKEKEAVMKKFTDGKLDILVSTSVIEVGVDVPNATVMAIEGAERFGLATLHQFRGRVGRGIHKSYCLLLSDSAGAQSNARLRALVKARNGFELAQLDLELRGPGQFMGEEQSGIPDIAMEALRNPEIIERVREDARMLFTQDPALTAYPALKERLAKMTAQVHGE